jgi:hypothetical protein
MSEETATDSGAGFRMTALPAAKAAHTPLIGIAKGKFHGGTTSANPRFSK